jgi:hypothetical protein
MRHKTTFQIPIKSVLGLGFPFRRRVARNIRTPSLKQELEVKQMSKISTLLVKKYWPFGLLIAGALVLWALGYRFQDAGVITFMALLIMGAGGYLVMVERQRRR